ncbi:MAG: magnesium transporter CorA family protein [Bacteroidales bacterium]|nr:magnesium transporter CorA family protein [Bacteroidales bacterium]
MASSKFFHFSPSAVYYQVASAEEAIATLKEGGFIWLDFYNPSKQDLNRLTGQLDIHPLSVEDSLDTSQVPKIEHFAGNTFFIFNAIEYKERILSIDEVDFFLGKDFLITVSGVNSEGREPFSGLEAYIGKEQGLLKTGPAALMHLILDYVVDRKFLAFDTIEDELDGFEDGLIGDPEHFSPASLLTLRKDLVSLRKSLYHERETLIKICRKDCPFISDKEIIHFRDIYDHLAKFFEIVEAHRETVTSLMELYTSLLNNLMTRRANETNVTVKRLTVITTVFMPLTLIASILGMSEWTMMTGSENWRLSYPLFFGAMLVIGLVNLYLIKRLGRKPRNEA